MRRDPHYAVYQPTIFLDELLLSDWDVMTYYARASTQRTNSYASEVYFLEVRPFREDILKMPGGPNGKAYHALNELSGLINRQQHVVRQTHQHVQKPPDSANLETQDRKKLADAEGDLSGSSQHLYARLAAELENAPIGEALDNLAQAQNSLDGASNQLQRAVMDQAQQSERRALAQLVAARKMFQKAISDNPDDFQDPSDQDEPAPVADASKKLSQMAEFRNEAKAANDFIHKTLQEQKDLERQGRRAPRSEFQRLGAQEQQLHRALEDFQNQHPEPFKGAETESQRSLQAMTHAADSLQMRKSDAREATQQATAELEKLSQAMQNQTAAQQLADAYRLKQMLDRQTQTFDQISKDQAKVSPEDQEHTVKEAQQTVEQLRKTAEQEPTRDAFGPALREALSGDNKVELDARLKRMERPRRLDQAPDPATRQQRAGEARDALGKVGKAFDQSQPKSLQLARSADSLKGGEQDSLGQGVAELGSLIAQLEKHRPLSPEDLAKQGQQALANLQSGMRNQFSNNQQGNEIIASLERALKMEGSPDIGDLKRLLEKLQHFSLEISEQMARNEDQPEVSNIDPARLPPAYRGRIQKYFQKLSEK